MQISVIVSTYNAPEWLKKVLWGFSAQSRGDFELLVADDGSTDETMQLIDEMRRQTRMNLRHIWHEDVGFRKCTILNKAIAAASGDYLVFTDGDCIPRSDFVAQHARLARPGRFLSGGAVRLPMGLSRQISKDDVLAGHATSSRWLVSQGMSLRKSLLMLLPRPRLAWLLDHLTTTRATWNGGNASAWKADILRVNGYDERMQHGGLDREMGERLENAGIRGSQIRHRAVCVHLEHARGYARPELLANNRLIREHTQRHRVVRTPHGINKEVGSEANAAVAL